jgi:hypothetical protein
VSCADTATAMELADDLLAGGPEQVDRLHAFATLSARRAAAAANDVSEPEPARLARAAAAVRQVWTRPRYTALAEAVVASPRSRRWRGGCMNSRNAATPSPMSSAASTPTG